MLYLFLQLIAMLFEFRICGHKLLFKLPWHNFLIASHCKRNCPSGDDFAGLVLQFVVRYPSFPQPWQDTSLESMEHFYGHSNAHKTLSPHASDSLLFYELFCDAAKSCWLNFMANLLNQCFVLPLVLPLPLSLPTPPKVLSDSTA